MQTAFGTHYKRHGSEEEGMGTGLTKMRVQEEWAKNNVRNSSSTCPRCQNVSLYKCGEEEWQQYKVVKTLLYQLFWNVLQAWNQESMYKQVKLDRQDKTQNIFG